MDRVIVIFVFLLLIIVGGVLVAPSFIDWNQYKSAIEAYGEEVTGRDVAINGDISFVLLPEPALTLEDFSVANLEEDGKGHMIRLESLEVVAALKPLIMGEIQVTDLRLVKPQIALEVLAGNRTNWSIDPQDPRVPPIIKERPWWLDGLLGALTFDHVSIVEGTLTYSDAKSGLKNVLTDIRGTMSAASLDGPMEAQVSAKFRGVGLSLDWSVGDMSRVRAVPMKLAAVFSDSKASLNFRGFLEKASFFGPIKGELTFVADDAKAGLGNLFSMVNGAKVATPKGVAAKVLSHDFNAQTQLTINGRDWKATDLVLGLGGVRAKGAMDFHLARQSTFALTLGARSLNLDSLLGEKHIKTKSVNLDKAAQEIEKELKGFLMPRNVVGTIDINVDGIIYRAGVIQNFEVKAKAKDGKITIKKARGRLPGRAELDFKGDWSPVEGGTKLRGTLKISAPNPRATLHWLDYDLSTLPSKNLQSLSFEGAVSASPTEWHMEKASLTADDETFGLTLGQEKAGLRTVHVVADTLDLDAYAFFLPSDLSDFHLPGEAGPLSPFDTDIDLVVHAKNIVWKNNHYTDVQIDLSSLDGHLAIDRMEIGNLNGAQISLKGKGDGVLETANLSLDVDIEAQDLGRFAHGLGFAQGAYVVRGPGRVHLSGELKKGEGAFSLNADFKTPGGTSVPLTGTLERRKGAFLFDGNSQADGIGAVLTIAQKPGRDGGIDGQLTISAKDLNTFIIAYSLPWKPAQGNLGPFMAEAQFSVVGEKMDVERFAIDIGDMGVGGTGHWAWRGKDKRLDGSITLGKMDLDALFPGDGSSLISANLETAQDLAALQSVLLAQESKKETGLLGWAAGHKGILEIKADSLKSNGLVVIKLQTVVTLGEGALVVSSLKGQVFDGVLNADLSYSAADLLPELKGTVSLEKAKAGAFFHWLRGSQSEAGVVTGLFSLEADISALGSSTSSLISTLNGEAALSLDGGVFDGFDMADLEGVIANADGLAAYKAGANKALSKGQTPYLGFDGTFMIDDGRLRASQFGGAVEGGTLAWSGEWDFNTHVVNGEGALRMSAHKAAPPIRLRFTGPAHAPEKRIESAALGAFFIDDFTARAEVAAKSKMDQEIDLLRSAIENLGDKPGDSETAPESRPSH